MRQGVSRIGKWFVSVIHQAGLDGFPQGVRRIINLNPAPTVLSHNRRRSSIASMKPISLARRYGRQSCGRRVRASLSGGRALEEVAVGPVWSTVYPMSDPVRFGHPEVGRKPRCMRWPRSPPFPQTNITVFSRFAIPPLQRDSCVTATGEGGTRWNFKTKAALAEWTNDQTMPEIAACYNGLPGVKPVKKFESRDVAVTRIWAARSPEPAADKPWSRRNSRRPALVRNSVLMRRSPRFEFQLIQDCRALNWALKSPQCRSAPRL